MGKYSNQVKTNEAWLPMIPSQWELKKIKWSFKERSEKGYPDEPLLVASQNMGVVPKNVYGKRTVEALKDLDKLKLVKVGDYVVSLRSFQGGIEYAYYQGIISPAYTIMRPNPDFCSAYYKFLFKSAPFIKLLTTCVTGIREGQNIDYGKLKNHYIPVPPRAEQNQIVRFLDWKVSEINKLTSIRKKQIKQLEEIKEKQIENALSHFSCQADVQPLKAIAYCNRESLSESTAENYSFRYIDIGSVDEKEGITHYEEMEFKNAPSRARRIVHKNDIIISTVRTYLKAITRITDDKDVIVSTGFAVLSPHGVDSKCLEYYFKSKRFCDEVIRESIGIAYPAIDTSKLMRIKILVPKYEEQLAITAQVHKNEILINQTISLLKKKIKQLQELKSTLISDVVTGKIDVRNIPVPAYEHVDDLTADDGEGNDEETGIPGEED